MDHSGKRSTKRWCRKRQVQSRYGEVCSRTIDRAVEDGRLPPPKYPFGNNVPYWDEDELDDHDRNLASRAPQRPTEQAEAEIVEAAAPAMPRRRRGRPRKEAEAPAVGGQHREEPRREHHASRSRVRSCPTAGYRPPRATTDRRADPDAVACPPSGL
jgi:hypothetical protein